MTFAIIGMVVIGVIVLTFVLEPVLRARSDAVVLENVPLPDMSDPLDDDLLEDPAASDDVRSSDNPDERAASAHVTLERPASSDAS